MVCATTDNDGGWLTFDGPTLLADLRKILGQSCRSHQPIEVGARRIVRRQNDRWIRHDRDHTSCTRQRGSTVTGPAVDLRQPQWFSDHDCAGQGNPLGVVPTEGGPTTVWDHMSCTQPCNPSSGERLIVPKKASDLRKYLDLRSGGSRTPGT